MKRPSLAVLAGTTLGLGIALCPALAFAQEAPTSDAPASEAPPAAGPAPTLAPSAGPPIRVHLGTKRPNDTARLYIRRTDGSFTYVCGAPCTADMAANSVLRVTYGGNEDDPHTFVIPSELGTEVDLEVRRGGVGALVGSIVLMGSGGALAISGLALIAVSSISVSGSASSATSSRDATRTVGIACIGLGVAAAGLGLVWFSSRSREPLVQGSPHGPSVYGRRDTVLGDVAVQKPRDASSALSPLATPLELSVPF